MNALVKWGLEGSKVESIAVGATNETWKVTDGRMIAYLRKYRSTDRQAVEVEHRIINAAADAGVQAPRPIPALDSAGTVVEVDSAIFALFEAADGEQLEPSDLTPSQAANAGRFLAELHQATASLPTEGLRSWNLNWESADWAQRVRSTAEHIPQQAPTEVDKWAYQRSIEQAAWLDDSDCSHSYTPTFPAQVIHGDYQHANLFFSGDDVSAVIDWNTAAAMCRGFEIVRACSFMFQLEPGPTASFVAGYRSAQPVSPAELLDGANAWGCFADHHVWAIEERYLKGNFAAERFIPLQPFRPFRQAWEALSIE